MEVEGAVVGGVEVVIVGGGGREVKIWRERVDLEKETW